MEKHYYLVETNEAVTSLDDIIVVRKRTRGKKEERDILSGITLLKLKKDEAEELREEFCHKRL